MDSAAPSLHNDFMCPVCAEPMVVFELEGVEIDRCLGCRGTWLDAGELDQLARLEGIPHGTLTEAIEKADGKRDGKRRCPRCSSKLRIAAVGSIEIDRCPRGHGLWFDPNEMESLIASHASGEEGAAARFFEKFFAADRKKGG